MTHWGIDRARNGWVVAALSGDDVHLDVVSSASALGAEDGEVVAIDIPLPPFPAGIGRRCEHEARRLLGARSATIFPTLPRWCYERPYDDVTRADARRRYGKAYSKQAWNLGPAIFDAEAARRPEWVETHPELAFVTRNNGNPVRPKRSWDGVRDRLDVLARSGVEVPTGGFTLPVRPDDVLDAVACAVVARDVAGGTARTVPADPEPGEPVIWF
jgi:predicted RNase H-like nuclease